MKRLYSILTVIVALFVFASLAVAGPFPTWDKVINSPGRFKLVMGGAAVFDKETGLVWEQSPNTTGRTWFNALFDCYQRLVGGRKGWRLPTIEELLSLVDPSNNTGNPDLPLGHPFDNVQSSDYWSITTNASFTSSALGVRFSNTGMISGDKDDDNFVWCVRGGQGIDGVQ